MTSLSITSRNLNQTLEIDMAENFIFEASSQTIALPDGHEECHFLMKFRMKRAISLLIKYEQEIERLKSELLQEKLLQLSDKIPQSAGNKKDEL